MRVRFDPWLGARRAPPRRTGGELALRSSWLGVFAVLIGSGCSEPEPCPRPLNTELTIVVIGDHAAEGLWELTIRSDGRRIALCTWVISSEPGSDPPFCSDGLSEVERYPDETMVYTPHTGDVIELILEIDGQAVTDQTFEPEYTGTDPDARCEWVRNGSVTLDWD